MGACRGHEIGSFFWSKRRPRAILLQPPEWPAFDVVGYRPEDVEMVRRLTAMRVNYVGSHKERHPMEIRAGWSLSRKLA